MSLQQKTYVDFKNLGDTGTSSSTSIQPVTDGEDATASVFGRPAENLRSRTEISRAIAEDLLYYRDRSYRYLMDLTAGGSLTWAGIGTGIVNNTTQLVLRPFLTPRTNQKGSLSIGTAAVNQLIYAVAATAYATDGMNAVTVEHRSVTGTTTPSVTISTGPVYRILVIFDSANTGHTASVVAPLVTTAIAGSGIAGKLTCTANGAAGNAILALTETSFDTKSHGAGTAGTATADVEAHSLAANALQTFTTSNPLQEGDLLAIRYDYRVEPTGGDANDPKGGVAGGRAESNQSRSNADVSANLFLAQAHPEWIPGCIPLCKVVNGNLHWLDGTVLAAGAAGAPGTALSSYVNSSAWRGAATLVYNGGISNSPTVDTPQEALDSVDAQLARLRAATWTVTDNSYSRGGDFNSSGFGIDQAIAATQGSGINGGVVYVRRGQYSGCFASGSMTIDGLSLRGEAPDVLLTLGATNTYTNTAKVSIENVTLDRASSAVLGIGGDVSLRNVTFLPGMLRLGTSSTAVASLDRCTMTAASISAGTTYGVSFEGLRVHATNSDFVGPDGSVASGGSVISFGPNVQSALFENCTFTAQNQNTLLAFTSFTTNTASQGIVFRKCTFSGALTSAYLLDIVAAVNAGAVQFEDCTFTNTSSSPLLRILPGAGSAKIKLIDCTLRTGTSAVTAGSYQQIITLCPAAGSTIDLVRCRTTLGQLNTGAGTVSSLEFGGNNSTNASNVTGAGITTITDCTIELASTVTSLPLFCFLYVNGVTGASTAVIDGLILDFNDKQLTGTPTNGPNGYGAGAVLTMSNAWVHKLLMKRPPVVNTATNVSILNSTSSTHYESSYSEGNALSAPIVARGRFVGGYFNASAFVSNAVPSGAPAFYFTAFSALDSSFLGGATQSAHAGVVVTAGGTGTTLKFRGCSFYLICGNTTTSGLQLIGDHFGCIQDCDIYYNSTGVAEAALYIAAGWQGLLIENNVITTNFNGLGTANVAAKGTATLNSNGVIMTGNVFRNVNGGALSIDATISSGTGNQVANNAFLVSVTDP